MRSLELTLSSTTARSLAVEADMLGFENIDAYLRWLIGRRFQLDDDSDRGRKLADHADRIEDIDVDGDVAAVADAAAADRRRDTDPNGETARIEDEELSAAAEALSSVEEQRLDLFARHAVTRTQQQLGSGADAGSEFRSDAPLGPERSRSDVTDLDEIEVPGWDPNLRSKRREAIGAAVAFLRDAEEATRSEFVDELFAEYPAGYETESSWWDCIADGLRQVDRVDPARETRRVWRYRTTPGRVTRISYR